MFPACDPEYLSQSLSAYPTDLNSNRLVSRVAHKMLDLNCGYWPTISFQDGLDINSSKEIKGKGRAAIEPDNIQQFDETATRNEAL